MKTPRNLWYVRHGDTVRGPYPGKLLSRQLLLGRVGPDDHVSLDQVIWQRIGDVTELMPPELQADLKDPVARQRLMAALRWEDERGARDRRAGTAYGMTAGDKRRGRERRRLEALDEVNYRQSRDVRDETTSAQRQRSDDQAQRRNRWQVGVLVILVSMAAALAYLFIPRISDVAAPECGSPARPKVNWSNCRLDGATLARATLTDAYLPNVQLTRAQLSQAQLNGAEAPYANFALADLRGANVAGANFMGSSLRGAVLADVDFSGANLAYADFTDAQITGAKFNGAALGKAIWVDGSVCAADSVGTCVVSRN